MATTETIGAPSNNFISDETRRDAGRYFGAQGLADTIGALDSITVLGAGASTVQVGLRADRVPPLPDTRGR
ncbi:hypothetical protein [Nocardia jiangxiensis]|uniref:hypothetical protein n=1 Tax=Nocardia jiangxiensis TaxID=282685 RepID=UPI0002DD4F7A|nr:hypothetical protein [Nocardia jiangxiensis]